MTNIDRWPEAFQDGIPKVGGRWQSWREVVVESVKDGTVLFTIGTTQDADSLRGIDKSEWTFLGFSDSAPVNQGAAAPDKQLFKKGDRVQLRVQLTKASGMGARLGAPATVTEDYDLDGYLQVKWDDGPLKGGQRDGGYFPQDFEKIGGCAPVVGPPPSLKAAVQQEGLSIPPQTGIRHEVYEARMREGEKRGYAEHARTDARLAQAALKADLAYDLEADAIRSNRVVRKAALKEMGQGDRRCFDLRGLREFEAIKSDAHKQWLWWITVEAPAAPKGNSP